MLWRRARSKQILEAGLCATISRSMISSPHKPPWDGWVFPMILAAPLPPYCLMTAGGSMDKESKYLAEYPCKIQCVFMESQCVCGKEMLCRWASADLVS